MSDTPARHPFLDDLVETVTLTSSILRAPVAGRALVSKVVKAGGSVYINQTPTFLGTVEDRTLFEYTFDLPNGTNGEGLVSIHKNAEGGVTHLSITFSPLGAVLALSAAVLASVAPDLGSEFFL